MREIVLDTEPRSQPASGRPARRNRCVELHNHIPTGKIYHRYFNPERDLPDEAAQVHGLTNEFLADKPVFSEEVDGFLAFIGEAPLIIHNASFDMGFINAELTRTGFPTLPMSRAVDTLILARRQFPGAPASLDALCKRFGVDLSDRAFHGALLDARLLAEVYLGVARRQAARSCHGGATEGCFRTRDPSKSLSRTASVSVTQRRSDRARNLFGKTKKPALAASKLIRIANIRLGRRPCDVQLPRRPQEDIAPRRIEQSRDRLADRCRP